MSSAIDLTDSPPAPKPAPAATKRPVEQPRAVPAKPPAKKAKAAAPHALLWICAAGKGQGRAWKAKALKVIGVYATKEAAETKKTQLMERYENCGHGDILVGDSWEDESSVVLPTC